MPAFSLIHITAAYSNAVLVAILPQISDCSKQLGLPISTPVTENQVSHFQPPMTTNEFMFAAWLTNRYWFCFSYYNMVSFSSPDNWFTQQNFENVERFVGKDNMTTNEAINFARSSFVKLGYKSSDFHLDDPPTDLEGPYDTKKIGHIPYCRVEWSSPKGETNVLEYRLLQFDIDMQHKQLVGMSLVSRRLQRPVPKIDVMPELESDYRKRTQGHMFFRTNAPPSFSNRTASGSEEPTVRVPVPH